MKVGQSEKIALFFLLLYKNRRICKEIGKSLYYPISFFCFCLVSSEILFNFAPEIRRWSEDSLTKTKELWHTTLKKRTGFIPL
jgi:hypothetical protein